MNEGSPVWRAVFLLAFLGLLAVPLARVTADQEEAGRV